MPEKPAKVNLSFEEIVQRFDQAALPDVDAVIGIQTGGRVPAVMCAYRLKCPLYMLPIHFRDNLNHPEHEEPVLFAEIPQLPPPGQRILLVDDVSVTGKTMDKAASILVDRYPAIITFVLKGKGDIVLFPEIGNCVNWPWFQGEIRA